MKTRFEGREDRYVIEEKDETGLIPEGVARIMVDYNPEGKPRCIRFYPRLVEFPSSDGMNRKERKKAMEARVKYYKDFGENYEKINPPRTQEEMKNIASHLEASLIKED